MLLELVDATVDRVVSTGATDDGGVIFGDGDGAGGTELDMLAPVDGEVEAVNAAVLADPALTERWVEETLRYDASSQLLGRTLTCDVELHGETMPAGARVALLIGAANHDPREYGETAERFDISRIIGQSRPMRELFETLALVAPPSIIAVPGVTRPNASAGQPLRIICPAAGSVASKAATWSS